MCDPVDILRRFSHAMEAEGMSAEQRERVVNRLIWNDPNALHASHRLEVVEVPSPAVSLVRAVKETLTRT